MSEKQPMTLRLPLDVMNALRPVVSSMRGRIRGITDGDVYGAALAVFLAFSPDEQQVLVETFQRRHPGLLPGDFPSWSRGILASLGFLKRPPGRR